MTEYHILNLGAGVQSTTLYLMAMQGRLRVMRHAVTPSDDPLRFDCAIFADTQDEPGAEERRRGLPDPPESVYAHLDWLDGLGGPPILRRTKGCLSADLIRGENSTGQRSATIPAFTSAFEGGRKPGQVRRQCTKEYKIEIIERTIRRDVLGLAPRRGIPRDVVVYQYIGISWDERSRAFDIERRRFLDKLGREKQRSKVRFPLLMLNWPNPGLTRADCDLFLEKNVPHKVYRSACIHCPFHDDDEWRRVLAMPASGERLIQIDTALRTPGAIVNRNMKQKLYLHRSCLPISRAVAETGPSQSGFVFECEGGCGL